MSCGIQAMARVVISAVWVLHTSATDTTANVRSAPPSSGLTGSELAEHLVARVEEAVARGLDTDVTQHVEELKDALRPTYSALPKNSVGKVDITNLKHALRRFFVHRKGWHISALVPEIAANVAGAEDLTQLDNALEAQVVMKSLFELSPGENGFDLHKLGVLATVIEQLIVEEAVGKLRVAYAAKKHNVDSVLTPAQAEDVLALYLAAYIRGRDVAKIPRAQLLKFERLTVKTFPNWVHIRKRMMDVLRNLFHDTHELSFQKVARVAEEVTHRFADWQNEQCHATKGHLLELEDDTTRGRVRLTEFYDAALTKGMYQFTESINYLRQIGALDESDELDPRVVVPNYISGPSNCVARTAYYSVCCVDACEDIFAQLEKRLGKAFASSAEIFAAVEATGQLQASGMLETRLSLQMRLAEAAAANGGVVALHGRLFSQWMHLAFPRDCIDPHRSGTVHVKTTEQWELETGENSGASTAEIENWLGWQSTASRAATDSSGGVQDTIPRRRQSIDPAPWTIEEEIEPVRYGRNGGGRPVGFRSARFAIATNPWFGKAVPVIGLVALLAWASLWKTSVNDAPAEEKATEDEDVQRIILESLPAPTETATSGLATAATSPQGSATTSASGLTGLEETPPTSWSGGRQRHIVSSVGVKELAARWDRFGTGTSADLM